MTLKRKIPRVATAALTLGGGAAAGCGDGDAVVQTGEEAWCDQLAFCYSYTEGQYLGCVYDYQDYVLSYYGSFCRSVIRDMWFCLADRVSCGEIAAYDYADCFPEIDYAYSECGFDFYYYY